MNSEQLIKDRKFRDKRTGSIYSALEIAERTIKSIRQQQINNGLIAEGAEMPPLPDRAELIRFGVWAYSGLKDIEEIED